MNKTQSNRQFTYPDCTGVIKMALYVNTCGTLFYGHYNEFAENRVRVKSVWIDDNGAICAKVE